jgi:LmbE family N-acetylglucosaminyl deacetylase
MWMQGHTHPDHFVDITDTFHFKMAALREHASQTGHMENLEELYANGVNVMLAQANYLKVASLKLLKS